jgi:hypothetical protein
MLVLFEAITSGVSLCDLAMYMKNKRILRPQEDLMETQIYFTMQKYTYFLSSKNPLKETKNPSRYYYYYNSIT